MFCSKCGAALNGAAFCAECGTSVVVVPNSTQSTSAPVSANPPSNNVGQSPKTNVLAIIGFVISIVGFVWFNWLGVVLGVVALNQIKKSEGREGGRGLAIAAIVIGALDVLLIGLTIVASLLTLATMGTY